MCGGGTVVPPLPDRPVGPRVRGDARIFFFLLLFPIYVLSVAVVALSFFFFCLRVRLWVPVSFLRDFSLFLPSLFLSFCVNYILRVSCTTSPPLDCMQSLPLFS